jgi:hypothetical protein
VAVSVSNVDLMERVCHLTTKIYREILCISRHHGEMMMNITMGEPNHTQVRVFSCTPQYRIVLSWSLLNWIVSVMGRIPFSFTNFITTPELSGPLYISPDIYHTQITEYLLDKHQCVYWVDTDLCCGTSTPIIFRTLVNLSYPSP